MSHGHNKSGAAPAHDKPHEVHAHEKAPEQHAPHRPDKDKDKDKDEGKWKFQILGDKEADFTDRAFFKGAIGHAWIRLLDPEGGYDSWGYWPDIEGGHRVDPRQPYKSVPGKVRHPDEAHSPTAMHTYEVDQAAAESVNKAAKAKADAPGMYNLFTYNCTSFAADMAKVAGVPVPSHSTLGIANPNALVAGISEMNKKQGEDAMERPLPPNGGGGH